MCFSFVLSPETRQQRFQHFRTLSSGQRRVRCFVLCIQCLNFFNNPFGYNVKNLTQYFRATTWLKLAFRDLILMQNEYKVQNFLITSSGLCPEHHIYISQLTGTNKRKLTETGISNVIDQLPLLSKSIAQQIILKKVQPVKPTAKMRKSYMPIREYCAFRNCVTHIKYDTKVRKFRFPTPDSQL